MPRPWDRFSIKAEVHRRNASLTQIATDAGLDSSACRSALIRRHFSGEKALADFLNLEPSDLWPERYGASTSRAKSNPDPTSSTSQKLRRSADTGVAA